MPVKRLGEFINEHNHIGAKHKSGKEWQKIQKPTTLDKTSLIWNTGKKETERTDY